MDISLIKHGTHFNLYICVDNIAVDKTVSQIVDTGPGSFSMKFRNTFSKKYITSYRTRFVEEKQKQTET